MNIIRKLWDLMPQYMREKLYPIRFRMKYGFFPPPPGTDLVGYETLIDYVKNNNLLNIPGDIVEIGAFCGGGTYKIANYLLKNHSSKKIYSIDIFDIFFDKTKNTEGLEMSNLYKGILFEKSQYSIYTDVIKGLKNIITIKNDSKAVILPAIGVSFAFIDGNHSPDYVVNDFNMIWEKLHSGGVIGFHDYGYDLPSVTSAIDQLYEEHSNKILYKIIDNKKHICYFHKK